MTLRRTMTRTASTLLLLLPAASAPPAAAATAAATDFAIRSVTAPRSATAGAPFDTRLTVARQGRAGAAAIGVYLSRDRVRDRTDTPVAGGARVPAAGRRAAAAVNVDVRAHIPAGQPLGRYFVVACVDDPNRIRERNERNNCAASARPLAVTATPVSSSQLLAAAVAAHKLSPQQALVYRVFAAFGDTRLPSVYAGDDTRPDDLVMRAAIEAWPTLSAAQQAELRPFFTPPVVSGSWFSPRGSAARGVAAAAATGQAKCDSGQLRKREWYTLAKPGGHVRLWWLKAEDDRIGPKMRPLVYEIENTIWPRLHKLMGRAPLSDAGQRCFHGIDGKLDIYMIRDEHALGETIPYPPRCTAAPTFIVFDVSSRAPTRWEVAHELMHSVQYAFHYRAKCDSYNDWDEATATWAGQYLYPHDDEEHAYTWWYPDGPLTNASYEGWLFPYAMEELHGAETIAAIYTQTERFPIAQAINAGVPGGLAQAWPEFALKAWNDGPVAPSFKQWDHFDQQPPGPQPGQPIPTETLDKTPPSQPVLVARTLVSLTRGYSHFTIGPDVTQVSMSQQVVPGIRVDAIERFRDGTTQVEQLQATRTICSTDPAKRLADLVLVISNSSLTSTGLSEPLKLAASDDTCGPIRYRVLSASMTEHVTAAKPGGYCAAFGGTSGWRTTTGKSAPPVPDDDSNQLAPTYAGGPLGGRIAAPVVSTLSDHGTGCNEKPPSTQLQPCTAGFDNWPFPGPLTVSVSISVPKPASGQATLDWFLEEPGIGGINDPCNVSIVGAVPYQLSIQTVPLARLLSPEPQTFTLAGSVHLDHDIGGGPASIDYDWNLSISVQRR